MLLAGADRALVCNALLAIKRALRKWINRFDQCGVDGLIVKKRPGRMAIINDQQALFTRRKPDRANLAEDESNLAQ